MKFAKNQQIALEALEKGYSFIFLKEVTKTFKSHLEKLKMNVLLGKLYFCIMCLQRNNAGN